MAGQPAQVRELQVGPAELGGRLVVVRPVVLQTLVGVEAEEGDGVDPGVQLLVRGARGRHGGAVRLGHVLPEGPRRVEDRHLERAVGATERPRERVAVTRGVGLQQRHHAVAALERLALHGPQRGAAGGGADAVEEAVVGLVRLVHRVVGRDVGHHAVHVGGVEAAVVDRRHAALAGSGLDPFAGVDGLERLDDPVLVGRLLPDRQVVPVGGRRTGGAEEAVLDGDLVAVQQPGRLGTGGRGGGGQPVSPGVEHHGRVGRAVQQGEPLLEGPLAGVAVVGRLGEGHDEEPVAGRLGLRHHAEPWDGLEPVQQVVLRRGRRSVEREGRQDGHRGRQRGQEPGSHGMPLLGGGGGPVPPDRIPIIPHPNSLLPPRACAAFSAEGRSTQEAVQRREPFSAGSRSAREPVCRTGCRSGGRSPCRRRPG